MTTTTTTKTTYRWLARQLATIFQPGFTYDRLSQLNWIGKGQRLIASDRTIAGAAAAVLNFDWMVESAIADAKYVAKVERAIALLDGREFCENL